MSLKLLANIIDVDRPIIAYHGTLADFSEFRQPQGIDIGVHFGTLEQAKIRLSHVGNKGDNAFIFKVKLNFKKALVIRDLTH